MNLPYQYKTYRYIYRKSLFKTLVKPCVQQVKLKPQLTASRGHSSDFSKTQQRGLGENAGVF
uniref:Uncharacterized protein n=1 Tax=Anguilla anguilla TaxID=7936 RepID=A0A0E9TER3_ANGAN